MNPAPGFKKYPGHRVSTNPSARRVQVAYQGEIIADTREAVELHEKMSSKSVLAPVVYYIPRKDVKMDRLVRTTHTTHCPFKGNASYWSITVGDQSVENAVWSYEEPYRDAEPIRGYLSFYPDKVSIEVT